MGTCGLKRIVSLVWVTLVCGSTIPVFASTDDGGKSEPPPKPVTTKLNAPAPLTERERWLLDRVEELEKRVTDLESKGTLTPAPAESASAVQPPSVNATTSGSPPAAPSVTAGAAPGNSSPAGPVSGDRVAAVAPQATEKGKSGAGQPGKEEPF